MTPEGRTVVLGAAFSVGAMIAMVAVTAWWHPGTAVRAVVLVLSGVAVIVGGVLMLRDYS